MSVGGDSSDWYEESAPNLSVVTTTNATPSGGGDGKDGVSSVPSETPRNCTFSTAIPVFFQSDYNVVTATICALYFVFGIFCAFFGYRCFKVKLLRSWIASRGIFVLHNYHDFAFTFRQLCF